MDQETIAKAIILTTLCLGIGQLVLVPAIASRKGKDVGIWFLLTLVWGAFAIWFYAIGIGLIAASLKSTEDLGIGILVGIFMMMMSLLPLLAVMLSGDQSERRYRRAGRHRRTRRLTR